MSASIRCPFLRKCACACSCVYRILCPIYPHLFDNSCSAAVSALPSGVRICPDFGFAASATAAVGAPRGYVDFYVDGNHNIGIELTRDGNLLEQHVARFGTGGVYAPLKLSSWVVVDFRQTMPSQATVVSKPDCIFVIFRDDYASATIKQAGQEDVEFHLRQ